MTWPFVTIPNFDVRTAESMALSGADAIAFIPLVSKNESNEWYEYADSSDQASRKLDYVAFHANDTIDKMRLAPIAQLGSASINDDVLGKDLFAYPSFTKVADLVVASRTTTMSGIVDLAFLYGSSAKTMNLDHGFDEEQPHSYIMQPVFEGFFENEPLVAFIVATVPWESYFQDLLPTGINGFVVDLKDSCGAEYTYRIDGRNGTLVGAGDLHDEDYDYLRIRYVFEGGADVAFACSYTLDIYPSDEFRAGYTTSKPAVYTTVVVLVFFFTAAVFIAYELTVQRRQAKVLYTAKRTSAIVSSIFPKSVQDRLMYESNEQSSKSSQIYQSKQMSDLMSSRDMSSSIFATPPIADLFPEATIMVSSLCLLQDLESHHLSSNLLTSQSLPVC